MLRHTGVFRRTRSVDRFRQAFENWQGFKNWQGEQNEGESAINIISASISPRKLEYERTRALTEDCLNVSGHTSEATVHIFQCRGWPTLPILRLPRSNHYVTSLMRRRPVRRRELRIYRVVSFSWVVTCRSAYTMCLSYRKDQNPATPKS